MNIKINRTYAIIFHKIVQSSIICKTKDKII